MHRRLLLTTLVASLSLIGTAATASAAAADTAPGSAVFTGTVSEIVDPAAETGIPRRWMRHVGGPAPAGYSHGYQWGSPSITTTAGGVTMTGTLDLVDAVNGEFGLIGLLDTATLAAGERGHQEGSYIYVTMRGDDTAWIGLSDGRGARGEYVQRFHTIDLTATDRVLDVTFSIDPDADPAGCASSPDDVATAEGCLTLTIDDRPLLTDSYGSITNDAANGGEEFRDGGTAGWDGLASATTATGIDYDLSVTPSSPRTKDDCKKGGWTTYGFLNQGQCVKSVVTRS
ncbi:hypothetical protein A7K94_0200145 [Modestobacter sp. VKM Ac-2676]|nr:hypothetical protein A7K94_0200145 [Modestobacter sp. VKM Ac-2676]